MGLDKSKVKKILIFSLSNIGDVILTFPVKDILRHDFPDATIDIMVSPKSESLLKENTNFNKIIAYDKRQNFGDMLSWMSGLRREKYDLFIDLKNSALPVFVWTRYRTSLIMRKVQDEHMKAKHLRHLKSVYNYSAESTQKYCLDIQKPFTFGKTYCVIAPGSANEYKRWSPDGFAAVADHLWKDHSMQSIFIGDANDKVITDDIIIKMKSDALNYCGKTNLIETAAIVQNCFFAITNDSAPMHMASYLNKPVIGIFGGHSHPKRYGPWSKTSKFIFKENIHDITSGDVIASMQL